jgi:hypothetical protein
MTADLNGQQVRAGVQHDPPVHFTVAVIGKVNQSGKILAAEGG